jgi:hypothetical protein
LWQLLNSSNASTIFMSLPQYFIMCKSIVVFSS